MCGIVGIASVRPSLDRGWLGIGRDSMIHRGPDDFGEWWSTDGRVGLAHRRLSILDLSSAGHQPMGDATGRCTIVFNGEIYNHLDIRQELMNQGHVFRSHSDTEVILTAYAAWGTECLHKFNGMFSFAITDELQGTIFIARDRAGEKPLFYRLKGKEIRFSSELKALLMDATLPRCVNLEALDCYLSMGYVPGNLCILDGFNKLPPAHAMVFNFQNGQFKLWQYWDLPGPPSDDQLINEIELLDEFEALLQDSVSRQMVADVPVGVLLSGGVDSSLITAMAVRSSRQVKTFTIGFPGYGKLDETSHARLISRYFGTEHTELMADPATADLIPLLAHQFDEPMVDSSMIPTYLVSQLVRQECKVALGGDGGDELFGGYDSYSRLLRLKKIVAPIPKPLLSGMAFVAGRFMPTGFRGRNWLQRLNADFDSGAPFTSNFFDAPMRRKLLKNYNFCGQAERVASERAASSSDLLQSATRTDFHNYLSEDILVKVDRSSMLSSLEVRAPLLDFRLIEFAFGKVPSYLKVNQAEKKILLKRLTARVLPKEFDRERKQGFSIPLGEWLKDGAFKTLFYDTLRSNDCSFDRQTVDDLIAGQENGRSNGERLFALVLFELWRKEYEIAF